MIKDAFHNNNIGDGAMALESIFHFIYDASTDARIMNSLNEQLAIANYSDALDIKEELSKYGYLKKPISKNKHKKKVNLYHVKLNNYNIYFGKRRCKFKIKRERISKS